MNHSSNSYSNFKLVHIDFWRTRLVLVTWFHFWQNQTIQQLEISMLGRILGKKSQFQYVYVQRANTQPFLSSYNQNVWLLSFSSHLQVFCFFRYLLLLLLPRSRLLCRVTSFYTSDKKVPPLSWDWVREIEMFSVWEKGWHSNCASRTSAHEVRVSITTSLFRSLLGQARIGISGVKKKIPVTLGFYISWCLCRGVIRLLFCNHSGPEL